MYSNFCTYSDYYRRTSIYSFKKVENLAFPVQSLLIYLLVSSLFRVYGANLKFVNYNINLLFLQSSRWCFKKHLYFI